MGRVVRIILYAIFFILIFLALSGIYEGCHKNRIDNRGVADSSNPSNTPSVEEGLENIANEFFEDEEPPKEQDVPIEDPGNFSNKETADEEAQSVKDTEQAPPINPAAPPAVTTPNPGASSGKYLVIAGSFGVRSNAESMVGKLKNMGFREARFFQFDASKYYTISAGSFDEISEAKSMSENLKSKGIDNYVFTKKE